MRFILYCGFDAGMHRDEACEARRDWFNLERGSLQILNAEGSRLRNSERKFKVKNGKQRHVLLTRPFRAFLKEYSKGLKPLDFALKPDVQHGESRYRYDFRLPSANFMMVDCLRGDRIGFCPRDNRRCAD